MGKDINKKTKSAFVWDLTGSLIRQSAGFIISIILARILDPKDFGIIGMSLVFVSISEVFVDVGFTSGLIQQRNTKDITYSSIFYVNLLISLLFTLTIILTAPLISAFYGIPEIKNILYYLSILPPIAAIGRVHAAILTKKMNFKSLTLRDITATIIGGIIGVTAAFSNFGLYSLVFQQLATVFTATILLWISLKWKPKLEFSLFEVKKLMGYSSYVFFDQALRQIFNRIDTIFIGKVFSPTTLGFYSRAESLRAQVQTYTTNSVRKVIFPALSALQDNPKEFEKVYHKVFNIVTGLTVLVVAPIFFLSENIIIGLLGQKWEPSIVFFQILLFTILTSPQIGLMASTVLAKGHSKLKFKIGIIQRLLKLTPIIFGLYFGIIEFTIAVVVAVTIVFIVYSFTLHLKLGLSFIKQMINFLIPQFIFLTFIAVTYFTTIDINNWLTAALFVITNIFYLKLIRHDSFNLVYNMLNSIYNNKIKHLWH